MFFVVNNPLARLLKSPQWLVMLGTLDRFRRLGRVAAWCLMPLAAWGTFASVPG
jgi:translocator protein